MKNKKGISLIVLVITIIIIIILAGAVILNLADNNPIENASEAQITSDLDTFNSDLTLQIGNKYLEPNGSMLKTEDFDSDESRDGWKLLDLVPSMKGTGYEEYLAVENSKLVLKIDAKLDDGTKEIIEEKLGKAVLTKEMILKEPEKYIGMKVEYSGYDETLTNQKIDWRLFGLDSEGNIMLKANDYVDLSYKTSKYSEGISRGNGIYNIKANSREMLINYLKYSSNWSEYAIEGKTTARGAMTLPEFIEGYNRVVMESEQLDIEELTEGNLTTADGTFTGNYPGYVIKKDTGSYAYYVTGITEVYNDMKFYINNYDNAEFMWLASASAYRSSDVMGVLLFGNVCNCSCYDSGSGGICPVVSLTSAILVENESGEFEVK